MPDGHEDAGPPRIGGASVWRPDAVAPTVTPGPLDSASPVVPSEPPGPRRALAQEPPQAGGQGYVPQRGGAPNQPAGPAPEPPVGAPPGQGAWPPADAQWAPQGVQPAAGWAAGGGQPPALWPASGVHPSAPWPTGPTDLAAITALPVEERSYPAFLRTPRWRWWKPLLALLAAGLVSLLLMVVLPLIGLVMDGGLAETMRTGKTRLGPWMFLGNNVAIALTIGVAMLTQWAFFGMRPRWLSSVGGGFRWGWFARCVAVVLPIWVIVIGIEYALGGLPPDIQWRPYSLLMIVGILLTTPFQAAGEEYLMRGLQTRLVASYFRPDLLGWIVGTLVSSVTFMLLHGATDPWLNLFYFTFGAVSSWIAWKTGGLEASVAIHVINNLLSELFMPFTDFSGMFDREDGAGDATVLFPMGCLLVAAALLWLLARRSRVQTRSAPGRAEVARAEAAAAASWQAWVPQSAPPPQ